jgi:Ala-tRNA(Pro) deacylase
MPPLSKLQEFLDANKVPYQLLTHPKAFTAQELAAVEHVKGRELAKVVVLRSGQEFLMVVLPAPYHVDLERMRTVTGKTDLALASEQEFVSRFPNCEPGAMPPFGNLFNMAVWVDESLTRDEQIVFNACTHTQAVRMKYADFARLVRPKVAQLRIEPEHVEAGSR